METEVFISPSIDLATLEQRCEELDQDFSQDSSQQFDLLCSELGINAEALARKLRAKCIWTLLGYVEEAINPRFWD